MQPKNVAIDKSIKVAKKTGPAFKSSLKDIAHTTSDIIVNYGDDLYDELNDVSTDGAKSLVSNGVMGSRNLYRATKSTNNILKRHHVKKSVISHHRENFKNLQGNSAVLINQPIKSINKNLKQQHKKLTKDAKMQWRLTTKHEKAAIFKKNKITQGINIKKSSIATVKNQTRKVINNIANKNDISSKVIGKSIKGVWNTMRYRRQFVKLLSNLQHVVGFVAHSISSLISFIVSLPVILTTIVSSIPLLVIISAIIMIMSIFMSTDYSGRLTSFVENEAYLEYRYDTNVAPDEILSITTALGWSSQKVEDYEALFAILMDGKDENWNISYETMQDNIFNKYNPANYKFSNSIEVKRSESIGHTIELLSYEDYLALFPNYKNMSLDKKAQYGSAENIAELKQNAKSSLSQNAINYTGQYVVTNNLESFFSANPLSMDDIRNHASTYKVGYRAFNDGAFHGGTDIAAETGTKAYAVANANVIYTQSNISANGETCLSDDKTLANETNCGKFSGGNQVILQQKVNDAKDGSPTYLYTAYYHLEKDSVKVRTGDSVTAGEYIGNVGNTGMSLGSHLHLQSWLDPMDIYKIPYSNKNDDTETWNDCIDTTMLLDNDFRNYIFGR